MSKLDSIRFIGCLSFIEKKIGKDFSNPLWWSAAADVIDEEKLLNKNIARTISKKLLGEHSLFLYILYFESEEITPVIMKSQIKDLEFDCIGKKFFAWSEENHYPDKLKTRWTIKDFSDCPLFPILEQQYYLTLGE